MSTLSTLSALSTSSSDSNDSVLKIFVAEENGSSEENMDHSSAVTTEEQELDLSDALVTRKRESEELQYRRTFHALTERLRQRLIIEEPPMIRATPYARSLTENLKEFNDNLRNMPKGSDQTRWEDFINDWFEPGALIGISLVLENGLNDFKISRSLIPRFFSLYQESANWLLFDVEDITKLAYQEPLASVVALCPNGKLITGLPLDNENVDVDLGLGNPPPNQPIFPDSVTGIRIDCRFSIEMTIPALKFKSIFIDISGHRRLFCGAVVGETVTKAPVSDSTRGGLPNRVLNFLRMSKLVSSMQDLIAHQKETGGSPRNCLIAVLERRPRPRTLILSRPYDASVRDSNLAAIVPLPVPPTHLIPKSVLLRFL